MREKPPGRGELCSQMKRGAGSSFYHIQEETVRTTVGSGLSVSRCSR